MKIFTALPLAALSTGFVIPEGPVLSQVAIEPHDSSNSVLEELKSKVPSKEEVFDFVEDSYSSAVAGSKSALDNAIDWALDKSQAVANSFEDEYSDVKGWIETAQLEFVEGCHGGSHHPHHPGPGHHPPHHPHHPHHPHKPNKTVYELISESKYTTKLATLINEDKSLVDLLNGTTANFTVFAPTDKAFEKIPEPPEKPPKELIKKGLLYHISPDFYPAGRVLVTRTVPTLLEGEHLSKDPKSTPQRLSTNIGLRGLTVNYYSRIVAVDIFGTNGVIHGIDSILFPPFKATKTISFLPSEFSTLELGLIKTGLYEALGDLSNHYGGTLFAPSNFAFQLLGPSVSGFLFSKFGLKYLKALLKYHVVANQTLYSDAFYTATEPPELEGGKIPKGKFHVDLPTLLEDRSLSIDVVRFGRLIEIHINGFQRVWVPDGIAKDGVIHIVNTVIIPPKKLGSGELKQYRGEKITVEDLKDRLEDLVEDDDDDK